MTEHAAALKSASAVLREFASREEDPTRRLRAVAAANELDELTRGSMPLDEYQARALPRLAALDSLAKRIDFSAGNWQHTPEGERYARLSREQSEDEFAAGL